MSITREVYLITGVDIKDALTDKWQDWECRDKVYEYLVNKGVYIVPLNGALRVTIASISLENCRKLPAIIKEAMNNVK